jgi:hypothetical protein
MVVLAVVGWGTQALHLWYSGSPDSFMVMLVALVFIMSSSPFWSSYPLR